MHTVNILKHIVETHQVLVYFVIILGLVIEGELFVLSAGIFAHLGALNFWLALFAVFLGVMGKTFLGYYIGSLIRKRWSSTRLLTYMRHRVRDFAPKFRQKPFWSIFISKFIMGANNIMIIFCGFENVNYRQFLKAEFSAALIWAPLLLSIGYFFSYTALHISREIWRFSFIILVLVISFFVFDKLVSWIYRVFEEFYDDESHR
jgi:membrane protein DedA with SNARE-associated domain